MKKRILTCLFCTVIVAAIVVGCGFSNKAASTDDVAATDYASSSDYCFEIIIKSHQSSYWQAVVKGVEQAAEELGVTVNWIGPYAESDIAEQVNMLNSAIDKEGIDGIGIAACDQSECLESLQKAMEKKIPVVCFDSGIPEAPDGSVCSTVSFDNYGTGAVAAENLYAGLKDVIGKAAAPVRIGEVNQEAASESVINRGLGFIDKFAELAKADGKTVAVIGDDKYVNDTKAEKVAESEADIIIEVAVPDQTTVELCANEAFEIMSKKDTIGMFGSNQVATEGILTANEDLNVLGTDSETTILAAGFDAGNTIKNAIKDGKLYGAVTQSPYTMGITTVQTLYAIANGETVSDILTEGYWYNADNMEDASIAPNLYD